MKSFPRLVAAGSFLLCAASCSKDEVASGEPGTAESGGRNVSAGGASGAAKPTGAGGTATAGGNGMTIGTVEPSLSAGGAIGTAGAGGGATKIDTVSKGGEANANTSSPTIGRGGASGTVAMSTGGTRVGAAGSNGNGSSGRIGVGGAKGPAGAPSTGGNDAAGRSGASAGRGQAGAPGAGGSAVGGKPGVGGATASAGAPGSAGTSGSVAPSSGCGKTTTLKSARASIEVPNVADTAREYILALPKNYDPNHPYRLVFAWHPWMGSAQMIASGGYYGLQKQANDDAIFVAAEGLNFTQGGQSGLGWGNKDGEDIAFYHAMLDRFLSELCIDENRIFSVGFSFGAMFSFTLGCTAESMTRAIVPMAGNTLTSGGCANGTRSVAVMALIGLQDTLLDGHRQAVTTYTKRDGCSTTTQPMSPSWCDGLSTSSLPCTCVSYQGCKDGYPVISCEYTAGHQQAPNPGPIWDFLAQF